MDSSFVLDPTDTVPPIRPMTDEERKASKQREEANAKEEKRR